MRRLRSLQTQCSEDVNVERRVRVMNDPVEPFAAFDVREHAARLRPLTREGLRRPTSEGRLLQRLDDRSMPVPHVCALPFVSLRGAEVPLSRDLEVHLAPVPGLDVDPTVIDCDVLPIRCQPRVYTPCRATAITGGAESTCG